MEVTEKDVHFLVTFSILQYHRVIVLSTCPARTATAAPYLQLQ